MPKAKSSAKITEPENSELFQIVAIPPEAPLDGMKTNLSNCLGQQDLTKGRSNSDFLVTYKQIIAAPLVVMALRRASCLSSALIP